MISSVIFDWKRTLYDPDSRALLEGAREILATLHKHSLPLTLVGKGGNDMYDEVKRLNVGHYFENVVFQEGTKEDSLFKPFVSKPHPSSVLFIGDRIKSELAAGKRLGATTIWVRQGKFADEMPVHASENPDYTVRSLTEAKKLLSETFGLE